LAVANSFTFNPANISVLLGNGNGTFQSAINCSAGKVPASLAVSDFNGDSKLDLVAANLYSANVSVLLGNGDGTFRGPVNYSTGRNPRYVVVDDFNGDGRPDLAVANESGNVSVLINTCVAAGIGLDIKPSNSAATMSWPFPSTGFVLESTTSLGSTNWQSIVETTVTNNSRLEVTVPFDQQQRYFRLRKP